MRSLSKHVLAKKVKTQYTKQSTASKRFIVQEGKAKILVNSN